MMQVEEELKKIRDDAENGDAEENVCVVGHQQMSDSRWFRSLSGRSAALKKSGYSDPVTITAVGNLREGEGPGEDVLRKLSSSGIALHHATRPSRVLSNAGNRSLTTVMLVFGSPKELNLLSRALYDDECKILLAYHQRDPAAASGGESLMNNARKVWLWKSLLSDDMDSGSADNEHKTTRLVLQDKYTEKGESPWCCRECRFAGRSFEDFSTHLKSGEHGYREWNLWASGKSVDRTNPANFVWGRSKEWDLLNLEDLADLGCLPYNPLETTVVESPSKEWDQLNRQDMAGRDCLPYMPLETTVVESPSKEKCKKKKLKRPLTVN